MITITKKPSDDLLYVMALRSLQYWDEVSEPEDRGQLPTELDLAVMHAIYNVIITHFKTES